MKKRLLLTLLPLSFLVAACGGNAPAEASSSRATGSSTSAVKSSESSAEQTSSQATDLSSSQAGGESTSAEPESSSTESVTGYEIECYLKKGSEVVTWWNDAEAVTYAYVWNGTGDGATDKQFLEAEFKEAYDEGKTLYFSVEVAALPEHILLIRCNPAVVTTLPTEWPSAEGAIWNQTNDGDVTQKTEEEQPIDAWYADLSIK